MYGNLIYRRKTERRGRDMGGGRQGGREEEAEGEEGEMLRVCENGLCSNRCVCVQVGKKGLLLSVCISYLSWLDIGEERFSALPCASLFCFHAAKQMLCFWSF